MRFTLNYRGPLRANGKPNHKHELRKTFHQQLKVLWKQRPLDSCPELLSTNSNKNIIKSYGGFNFAPLVCQYIGLVAELDITMLRPEEPGKILTQGGDIDNRLKTLFDALQIPNPNQIKSQEPADDETPFFCLLEDDNLIKHVSVKTDRLLEYPEDQSEVLLIIYVITRSTIPNWYSPFLM